MGKADNWKEGKRSDKGKKIEEGNKSKLGEGGGVFSGSPLHCSESLRYQWGGLRLQQVFFKVRR